MPAWNFATLVDAIARATPDREVVVHGARRVTWRQLAHRARALAWWWQAEHGLGAGDKVAIVLPNCLEYVETFLATRKLHGAPLGLDPGLGPDALLAGIDGSDARLVVCSPTMAETLRRPIRRIPRRWRPALVEVGPRYEQGIAASMPPADWEIEVPTPDDLIAIATYDASATTVDDAITLLPLAPLAQGDGFAELLGVLRGKGRVVFVDSPRFDAHLVWQLVDLEGVVAMTIDGDQLARPLLGAIPTTAGRPTLETLRTIRSSDAPLGRDVVTALEAALPGVTIVGRIEELDTRVADPAQQVDPSAVEARLREHRSVADCVVLGISDPRIGKVVVAVVQVVTDHHLDAAELAAWCRAHVPPTMTPGRFVVVERIERSPSGHVDEQALRALAIDQLANDR